MAKKKIPPERDMTGKVFERLSVVARVESDKHRNSRYLCHCSCGATVVKPREYLLRGKPPRSCGCARIAASRINLMGKVFGRLTVLYPIDYDRDGGLIWYCRCTCGNFSRVRSISLRNGDTRSCGCLRAELAGQRSASRRRDKEKLAQTGG